MATFNNNFKVKNGLDAGGTITSPGLTTDIINATSVSTTTADIFGNVTTGTVGVADGLTTGTLNIGNGTTSSTGRTVNINTNASGSVTVTTNIGSNVLGGTINLSSGLGWINLIGNGGIRTQNVTSNNSANLVLNTGSTTTSGNSGSIAIDVGTAAGTAGTVSIGTTTASALTIGRSGVTTTIDGTASMDSPLLRSVSTVGGGDSEGGQINFARVTDGAQYWYIDSFGSTSTPNLRFVAGSDIRFEITSAGAFSVNGQTGANGQVLTSQGVNNAPTWNTPAHGVAWTGFASGYNYYAQGGSQSNGTQPLNSMTLVPFALSVSTTFTRIGIFVNTASSGATVRLGIYNSTNGIPSSRLLDAGTVATTSSSTLTLITINQTLPAGLYWLAAVNQGTAVSSCQIKGGGHVPNVPFFGSPANGTARGLQVTGVSGALPNPVGTLGMASTPIEVFLQV